MTGQGPYDLVSTNLPTSTSRFAFQLRYPIPVTTSKDPVDVGPYVAIQVNLGMYGIKGCVIVNAIAAKDCMAAPDANVAVLAESSEAANVALVGPYWSQRAVYGTIARVEIDVPACEALLSSCGIGARQVAAGSGQRDARREASPVVIDLHTDLCAGAHKAPAVANIIRLAPGEERWRAVHQRSCRKGKGELPQNLHGKLHGDGSWQESSRS
ncbi:hypothetical protein B0T17DRAFT_518059 [Bombardia bombarda]|uniref:Uncharacterized protein n=1 Tax=Bombardia bombarda TaxID=252184 RepID=A0AA39XLF4_9PEZI|nr:hypothetical protein B0T17DRAFT_518059 [Bombardia bombarda]